MSNADRQLRIFDFNDPKTWPEATDYDGFCDSIDRIRGYHGCRVFDMKSYQTQGILLPDLDTCIDQAFAIMDGSVSRDTLRYEIKERWTSPTVHGVFFVLDKSALLRECGHYLLRGSEMVQTLCVRHCFENRLEKEGVPTIVTVEVPPQLISKQFLEGFVADYREEWQEKQRVGQPYYGGMMCTTAIGPEYIRSFEQPTEVFNPFTRAITSLQPHRK